MVDKIVGRKVYLVTSGDGYDERDVIGIYSVAEVAIEICEKGNFGRLYPYYKYEEIRISDQPQEFCYEATWSTEYVNGAERTVILVRTVEGEVASHKTHIVWMLNKWLGRACGSTAEEAEKALVELTEKAKEDKLKK